MKKQILASLVFAVALVGLSNASNSGSPPGNKVEQTNELAVMPHSFEVKTFSITANYALVEVADYSIGETFQLVSLLKPAGIHIKEGSMKRIFHIDPGLNVLGIAFYKTFRKTDSKPTEYFNRCKNLRIKPGWS